MRAAPDNLKRFPSREGRRRLSVTRCRALLREGGAPEASMTDAEVLALRDRLAALADVLIGVHMGARA